jgi:Cdc6-like AAA superfamily ATPase
MATDITHEQGGWTRIAWWMRRLISALHATEPTRPYIPAPLPPVGTVDPGPADLADGGLEAAPDQPIAMQRDLAAFADPRRRAVHNSFNSTQPIASRRDLYGRGDILESLFEAVIVRQQHVLIYGARGTGKTSLVRVFADYADQHGVAVIYTACEPQQSFGGLMAMYLADIPDTAIASRDLPAFRARVAAFTEASGAREMVEALSFVRKGRVILILDEYDRIADPKVRAEVAGLLKLLSDASIPVQIMLVGIARDLRHLVTDHPSLQRHLSAFPLGRIDARAVREMIQHGGKRIGIMFDDESQQLIVDLACGSPYHARLFCAHAALRALRDGSDEVTAGTTLAGIVAAANDWALLSGDDADRFHELVATSPGQSRSLAAVARLAALEDVVSHARLRQQIGDEADSAIATFGPALIPDGPACHAFRDSVAPQFFLALLAAHTARAEATPSMPVSSHP